MNIEVCETTDGNLSGSPELWVIVRSSEIFDLPHVLTWVDKKFPGLWETYDRARPIFWPHHVDPAERAEHGFRFLDYWIFESKVA